MSSDPRVTAGNVVTVALTFWAVATGGSWGQVAQISTHVDVRLLALDRLTYGLDCMSHGPCHEYFVGQPEAPLEGVTLGDAVLISFYFQPGEAHPTRKELDRHHRWQFQLKRHEECDSSWKRVLADNRMRFLDTPATGTDKPKGRLLCFDLLPSGWAPLD